ncbi:MBG domain-containing protein, partial [Nocardioides bigeumensis]|uniref:MBG domain-containing protein n=1 Tax=Nocardioides bigeumensis TaxID=433657 RepID=UPI0031D1930F
MPARRGASKRLHGRSIAKLTGAAVAALLVLTGQQALAAPAEEGATRSDFLVTFAAGTTVQERDDALAQAGALVTSTVPPLRLYAASLTDEAAAGLSSAAGVVRVERDQVRELQAEPDDPSYADQWALRTIGWDTARADVTPAGSAVVAVLDTGVNATDDLAGALLPGASMLGDDPTTGDPNGHGTDMASIVAAGVDNGVGIAGVGYARVKVLPIKVLGADGLGQDSAVVEGVVYAADHGADVILMSFSNPGASASLQAAVDYAWARGAVLVAATGNDGSTTATYPAGTAKVVGVSATDRNDALWSSSNSGADTFLAAPGVDIATGSSPVTGTSASAAIVAGAAALVKANDPAAGNGVVVGRLARNADVAGSQSDSGNGRVNLARALADSSTDPIVPEGVAGDGGPVVGPYVAAAKDLDLTFVGSGSVAWTSKADNKSAISGTCNGTPNPCRIAAGNDEQVVLVATPSSGVFTGACAGTGTCTVTMNVAKTATVTFGSTTTTTTTTLSRTAGTTPGVYGSALTFTASVTGNPGNPGNVGTVTFKSGTTTICSAVALSSSTATCSPAKLPVGTYSLTAEYSGGTGFSASSSPALAQVVTVRSLTGSFTAANKSYDGNADATVTGRSLSGVLDGDTVTLDGGTAAFNNKLVANGKTVTLSGASLGGSSAGNYSLGSIFTTTANITAKALTITADSRTKTFGESLDLGTTAFTTGAGQLVSGDSVTAVTLTSAGAAANAPVVAGGYPIVPSGATGVGLANYDITYVNGALTVAQEGQTIAFLQPTGKTYGDSFSVSPTSDSNLTVSVAATGGCTAAPNADASASGYLVTITSGTSDCVLTASQAGNANYAPATNVERTVTVSKKALTVTVDADPDTGAQESFSKVYGSTNPAFSVRYAGFVSGDLSGALGGTLAFSTTATSSTGVGSYGVEASGLASSNYSFVYVDGTLSVTRKQLTVTADDDDKVYGSGNPSPLTFAYSGGFVGGDDAGDIDTAPTCATDAVASSPVGEYDITCSGADDENYSFVYVDGTLSVTRKQLTVTADDDEKVYGSGNPAPLTFAYADDDFVNGDDAGDIDTAPTCA